MAEIWYTSNARVELRPFWDLAIVIVIIISKFLKHHSKASAVHQLIHERCVDSERL